MQKTRKNPSAWLDSLPEAQRASMQHLDRIIADAMMGHDRILWEGVFWGGTEQTIIGYGNCTFTGARDRKVEWFMVGLALQKQYISVYVNAVDGGQYVAEKYRKRLGKVKAGKASISFKRIEDIDIDVLREIVAIARKQLDARGSAR